MDCKSSWNRLTFVKMAFVGKFVLLLLLLLLLLPPTDDIVDTAPPLEFAARVLAFNGADIGALEEDACEDDDELIELLAPRLFDLLRKELPLDELL